MHGWQGTPFEPSTWNASDYSTDVLSVKLNAFIEEAASENGVRMPRPLAVGGDQDASSVVYPTPVPS